MSLAILSQAICTCCGASSMTESDCVLQQQDALQNISLPNGRQISFSECGDISGRPVLFFHPIQGNRLASLQSSSQLLQQTVLHDEGQHHSSASHCRYMPLTIHKYALALRLRIIAPDRPGIGQQVHQIPIPVNDYNMLAVALQSTARLSGVVSCCTK